MTLQEFRTKLDKLKIITPDEKLHESVCLFLTHNWHDLPQFPPANFVQKNYIANTYFFDGKTYGHKTDFTPGHELFVDPTQCVGTTWLYRNDRSEGRPYPNRLILSLCGSPKTAPPAPAECLGDKYMCNDGNHRIYAAYLLGEKVKIRIEGTLPLLSK